MRTIRVNKDNRVVYNIPWVVPVYDFWVQHTELLIACVPVTMAKRTAAYREPMPQFALVLRQSWQAKRSPLRFADSICIVCDAVQDKHKEIVAKAGLGGSGDEAELQYQCYKCLTVMHQAVSKMLFVFVAPIC